MGYRLKICCSARPNVELGNGCLNSKMIVGEIWLVLSWKVTYYPGMHGVPRLEQLLVVSINICLKFGRGLGKEDTLY